MARAVLVVKIAFPFASLAYGMGYNFVHLVASNQEVIVQPGCRKWLWAIVFTAAVFVTISRRPDAVLNAQFFAEDGTYWYHDAYQFGFRSLLMPQAG